MRITPPPTPDQIAFVQKRLKAKGFDVDVTGQLDPRTIAAIEAFENGNGMPRDGVISDALIAKLSP